MLVRPPLLTSHKWRELVPSPGVWFADVIMTYFSGVTFVLFCFVFVFMLSLKPQPFVQSSFDIYATPVLSICPLHTNSGCEKERRISIGPLWPAKAAIVA